MHPSRNLSSNLRPFESSCEYVALLPPNRFAVEPRIRIPRSRLFLNYRFWVIGTMIERVDVSSWHSMREVRQFRRATDAGLTLQQMQCLDPVMIPDFDAIRSVDAEARFTLNRADVRNFKRIIGLKDHLFPVYETVKLSNSNRQLYAFFTGDRDPFGDAMLACCGISNDAFNRTIFTYAFRFLREEDYDATFDVDGNLELVGLESGLVFLIPADRMHRQS
jgi:hypothetical protein